ncbi:hypothetical protein HMPREF3232_01337 [Fannyhessea vaginae]|nr:hypothetical protein HMPREF3232_01337 [Fannyhessea vaginae]
MCIHKTIINFCVQILLEDLCVIKVSYIYFLHLLLMFTRN